MGRLVERGWTKAVGGASVDGGVNAEGGSNIRLRIDPSHHEIVSSKQISSMAYQ